MTFPGGAVPWTVELAHIVSDGVWTDVTRFVRVANGIVITRGRADEANQTAPQTCTLTIDNTTGDFTPRNPMGAYYGRIGRNTLARVKVGSSVRILGEIADLPPRWDPSETDHTVTITISGLMRRLGQGRPPALTGLRNYILANDPNNYWPLDEGELAGFGRNASPNSSFNFYPWPGSGIYRPVIKFGTAELGFNLPNGLQISRTNAQSQSFPYLRGDIANLSTEIAVDFLFKLPEIPAQLLLIINDYNENAWQLTLRQGAFDDVQLARNGGGIADSGVLDELTDGALHHLRLSLEQDGADVDYNVYIDGEAVLGGTVASVTMNGCAFLTFQYPQLTNEQPMGLAHVVYWDGIPGPASDAYNAMTGYDGETAADRIDRIAGEQLVGLTLVGAAADTARMGPQIEGPLLEQARDAAGADLGTLYEPRDTLGLAYRTRASVYNDTPAATINYVGQIAPPLEPTDDDQLTRNDITAKRAAGGTVRNTLETGPLSVLEPPDGVGPYPDEVTVNVHTDDQLDDVAGWLLNLGTWDESRYPVVTVERAAPGVAGDAALFAALMDVDVDDTIRITNLPRVFGDVLLLARGYTETIGTHTHTFAFNCSPAGPFQVAEYADDVATTGSRYAPDALRLWGSLTPAATKVDVLFDEGPFFGADDLPYDIVIGGERMTVTAVTGAQQFVANAAAVSGNNTSPLSPLLPTAIDGDMVLIFASIRNSGTGSPDQPSGFATVWDGSNAKVFARTYDGPAGWTMPPVTFTGGVAGADTIAQACSFRGLALGWFTTNLLNGSAQNIATPAAGSLGGSRVAFWTGWKQDDWTSAAVLNHPGAVEIQERTSGAGDDASQVWDYKIFTDPHETIPGRSFVITGGAAAISRAAVIQFWGGQRLTVTRAVNGVTKSHAAGVKVEMYQPARYAL